MVSPSAQGGKCAAISPSLIVCCTAPLMVDAPNSPPPSSTPAAAGRATRVSARNLTSVTRPVCPDTNNCMLIIPSTRGKACNCSNIGSSASFSCPIAVSSANGPSKKGDGSVNQPKTHAAANASQTSLPNSWCCPLVHFGKHPAAPANETQ